jgi:hypothetical protein
MSREIELENLDLMQLHVKAMETLSYKFQAAGLSEQLAVRVAIGVVQYLGVCGLPNINTDFSLQNFERRLEAYKAARIELDISCSGGGGALDDPRPWTTPPGDRRNRCRDP